LLALAAVSAVLLITGTDDSPAPQRAETPPTATATATPKPKPKRKTPAEPAPARAIRGFYEAAARDDWERAWELAGPQYRSSFKSPEGLQRGLDSLQRIRFRTLRVVARSGDRATVEVATTATHADRVDRCAGTLLAVRVEGQWRADPLSLVCDQG
jgi:hypothetical protein